MVLFIDQVVLLQCNHHLLFLSKVCIISWVKIQSNNLSSLFVGEWKWVSFDMISHLLNHYLKSCKYKTLSVSKRFHCQQQIEYTKHCHFQLYFHFFSCHLRERETLRTKILTGSSKEFGLFNVVEATCEKL